MRFVEMEQSNETDCIKIPIINLIKIDFFLFENTPLGKPHTEENVVFTLGNNIGSLQLSLPSISSSAILKNFQMTTMELSIYFGVQEITTMVLIRGVIAKVYSLWANKS